MKLAVLGSRTGEQPPPERTGLVTGEHLRECRFDLIIADDELVAGPRIERHS